MHERTQRYASRRRRSQPGSLRRDGARSPRSIRPPAPRLRRRAARSGPDKIALLEEIALGGSLSHAALELGMSYRRAWALLQDLDRAFGEPVAIASVGGRARRRRAAHAVRPPADRGLSRRREQGRVRRSGANSPALVRSGRARRGRRCAGPSRRRGGEVAPQRRGADHQPDAPADGEPERARALGRHAREQARAPDVDLDQLRRWAPRRRAP